jgi:hypothetical protein
MIFSGAGRSGAAPNRRSKAAITGGAGSCTAGDRVNISSGPIAVAFSVTTPAMLTER